MNRLTIAPGLRRLWRDQHEIQFGLDPARAVVIHLTDPVHARLFELLDGTRSERAVLRDATSLGIASRDAFDLLTAVRDAGLVVSAGTILPDSLTEPVRARLTIEAAAITSAQRRVSAEPTSSHPPSPAEVLRRRLAASVLVTGLPRLVVPIASALAGSGVGHVDTQLKGRVIPADVAVGASARVTSAHRVARPRLPRSCVPRRTPTPDGCVTAWRPS